MNFVRWPRLYQALYLALPFLLVVLWMRWRVPHWGDAIAHALQDVAGAPPREARPDPPEAELVAAGDPVVDAGVPVDSGARALAVRVADAGVKDDGGPITLYVKADAVDRALASQGKNVRGRTARNAEGKPIGVRLTGVSQFGVGLADGDLIVAIDGKPTMDDDTATDVVLSAIGQGKSVIHAKLVRGARPIDLTVEIPLDAAEEKPKSTTGRAGGDAAAKTASDAGARR